MNIKIHYTGIIDTNRLIIKFHSNLSKTFELLRPVQETKDQLSFPARKNTNVCSKAE